MLHFIHSDTSAGCGFGRRVDLSSDKYLTIESETLSDQDLCIFSFGPAVDEDLEGEDKVTIKMKVGNSDQFEVALVQLNADT